jgi:hypothetical protein
MVKEKEKKGNQNQASWAKIRYTRPSYEPAPAEGARAPGVVRADDRWGPLGRLCHTPITRAGNADMWGPADSYSCRALPESLWHVGPKRLQSSSHRGSQSWGRRGPISSRVARFAQ